VAEVIRIDEAWLAVAPLDMRAGFDTVLARVVAVFDAAHPHHAYLFTNRRANRMKVLVHDGIGIWLASRRLSQGQFVWPPPGTDTRRAITQEQLDALVLGLPWQRIGQDGVIRVV
jgi:transposase